MPKSKIEKEPVERVTLKLSKSVAAYFRKNFPHGKRSNFVAKRILEHKHEQEVKLIEDQLRRVGKIRQ